MTWYIDPETGDVYDHNEDVVGSIELPGISDQDMRDAMREAMDGDQPSAYNQTLLADLASQNWVKELPPSEQS